MPRIKAALLPLALLALAPAAFPDPSAGPAEAPLTAQQRDFMKWRFGMFVHFNLATAADTDWAGGYEDPAAVHTRQSSTAANGPIARRPRA